MASRVLGTGKRVHGADPSSRSPAGFTRAAPSGLREGNAFVAAMTPDPRTSTPVRRSAAERSGSLSIEIPVWPTVPGKPVTLSLVARMAKISPRRCSVARNGTTCASGAPASTTRPSSPLALVVSGGQNAGTVGRVAPSRRQAWRSRVQSPAFRRLCRPCDRSGAGHRCVQSQRPAGRPAWGIWAAQGHQAGDGGSSLREFAVGLNDVRLQDQQTRLVAE